MLIAPLPLRACCPTGVSQARRSTLTPSAGVLHKLVGTYADFTLTRLSALRLEVVRDRWFMWLFSALRQDKPKTMLQLSNELVHPATGKASFH